MFRPLPVERVDRLVDVFTSGSDDDQYATSSYPDFLDFKSQNQVFSDMLAYSPAIGAVKLTDRSRLAMGETVTGNYFQMLGVRAIVGRTLLPDDDKPGAPRVVVISYRLWNREYGREPVGDRPVDSHPRSAVHDRRRRARGRSPAWCRCSRPELWTPMAYVDEVEPGGIISTVPSPTGNTRLERRGTRWMFVKGRLKDGVTYDNAAANLRLIGKRLQTDYQATNKRFDDQHGSHQGRAHSSRGRSDAETDRARADARGRTRAGHRVRQRRQHAAGARVRASEGNRHPPRDRREPRAGSCSSCSSRAS